MNYYWNYLLSNFIDVLRLELDIYNIVAKCAMLFILLRKMRQTCSLGKKAQFFAQMALYDIERISLQIGLVKSRLDFT